MRPRTAKNILDDIHHENWWWSQHRWLATPTSQRTHDEIIANLESELRALPRVYEQKRVK